MMRIYTRFSELLNKFSRGVNIVVEALITASLASILALLIVTVFSRYLFRISAPWAPEYVSYATALIGAFGFSCLVYRRTLLSITFLRDKFSITAGRVFDLLVWVGIILYFRLFVTYGLIFAESVRGQFSPSRAFRLEQVRLLMPIGGVLIVFQAFNNVVQDIHAWLTSSKSGGFAPSPEETLLDSHPETEQT